MRAESREPRAESREPRAESREPRAESREPRAESTPAPLTHRRPRTFSAACPGRGRTFLLAVVLACAALLGSQPALARDAFDDYSSFIFSSDVRGIWSDGQTVWASDDIDDNIWAYDKFTGDRKQSEDFLATEFTASGNLDMRGIWSDGVTMYVVDQTDDKVYAYKMSDKTHDSDKDFNLEAGHEYATAIWSDGQTMWVAENGPDFDISIMAYNLKPGSNYGQPRPAKDFTVLLGSGNSDPVSIWSDGVTMYVADDLDNKVYAYNMSNKLRASGKEFDLDDENAHPGGIWSDGKTMYVADYSDFKFYLYSLAAPVWDSDIGVERFPTQITGKNEWLGYHHNRYYGERGSLTDKTFRWKGDTYTVRWLSSSHRKVRFGFTSGNSGDDASILKALRDNVATLDNLIIGGNRYRVADATGVYEGTSEPGFMRHLNLFRDGAYQGFVEIGWTNRDAPWQDGDTVNVKLLDAEPGSFFWEGKTTVNG